LRQCSWRDLDFDFALTTGEFAQWTRNVKSYCHDHLLLRDVKSLLCLKSLKTHISFTPGFSPVIRGERSAEPFQRFLSGSQCTTLSYSTAQSLEKNSKPLKRFTN